MGKFAPSGPASPSVVQVQNKSVLSITSDTVTTAGTEITLTIPAGTVAFSLRGTLGARLSLATTSGNTATDDKWDIPAGNSWSETELTGAAMTLYLTSNKDNTVIQLQYWS